MTGGGGEHVELDAADEKRVRRLLGAKALQAAVARDPLGFDDLPAESDDEPI